jgi:hypothetical protein
MCHFVEHGAGAALQNDAAWHNTLLKTAECGYRELSIQIWNTKWELSK